jgi:feruloyl esterase
MATTVRAANILLLALGLSAYAGSGMAATRQVAADAGCAELNGKSISAADIGLPTTGATVTSTQLIAAKGQGSGAIGEYCKVLASILPVDPQAPKINLQLNLPTAWNGKALMLGGGGYNGTIRNPAGNVPHWAPDTPGPLARGYATFNSDSGHQSGGRYVGLHASLDGTFGLNDEAVDNFSGAFIKKTRDVALQLIRMRYGEPPSKTYIAGGSTGGREALRAITNWPQDFDGAIAWYPAWNPAALNLQLGRITRALARPGAYPNAAKRNQLYDAVMEACDAADGVRDGIVSNLKECKFNPATLRCPGGADLGDGCLSDAQIGVFDTYHAAIAFSYPLGSGEAQYPGFNVYAGVDTAGINPIATLLALNTDAPVHPATLNMPYLSQFWDMWVRYFVAGDPNLSALTVDPQNPGVYQQRISYLTAVQDIHSFDLSAFKNRGGKLLMAHGTADALVSTRSTADYYRRLAATMGAPAVNSFARYYEIPGFGQVFGRGFTAAWDSLTALENWVERGNAPVGQVTTDINGGAKGRTRPLCEYPSWPKYNGTGDVNAAASFSCVNN